jgi:hypothetical protein
MEISTKILWSSLLEDYFKELGEKCYCYSYLHKKAEAVYSFRRTFIDLPVIVGSTLAGTLSIGNSALFGEENEQMAGVCIGALSLIVGIMNTIGSYYSWGKRAETHRLSSIEFGKLYRFLSLELSVPREQRISCSDLLKITRDTYERLMEVSPLIPQFILDDFKKRFADAKYEDISKPAEANGLERIDIYTGTPKLKITQSFKKVIREAEEKNDIQSPVLSIRTPKVVSPNDVDVDVSDMTGLGDDAV